MFLNSTTLYILVVKYTLFSVAMLIRSINTRSNIPSVLERTVLSLKQEERTNRRKGLIESPIGMVDEKNKKTIEFSP